MRLALNQWRIIMDWWGVSGSWRLTRAEIETDVRKAVRDLVQTGNGIVSGGALNVDYFATDEALIHCPSGKQVKIILPTPLAVYAAHFRKRAKEGVLSQEQAESLISLLRKVKKAGSLVEMAFDACTQETYYARNSEVIKASTALLAFQVNASRGVQDTIDKARARGMNVILKRYAL